MVVNTLVVAGLLLELMLYGFTSIWKIRKIYSLFLTAVIITTVLWGGIVTFNAWLVLLALVSVFRIVNIFRILKERMHPRYLEKATRRTGINLVLLSLIILICSSFIDIRWKAIAPWLAAIQMLVALLMLGVLFRNIIKSKLRPTDKHLSDSELPTVTVAVPARNETPELGACLASIIDSDYPKLEILVLDDCSHDKTPEIIKSLAHKGVRFIKGVEPVVGWLAKNQALERLTDEANGEVILFCSVDIRLGRDAIRTMVTAMINRKKTMMTVMPTRRHRDTLASAIQPMRYWWELAMPRRLFNRPATLSSCWMINRQSLQKLGGFKAVHRTVRPEGYFAREIVKHDGYSFIRANDELDVETRKSASAQRAAAMRTRYPELRKRPEAVLLLLMIEVTFFVLPALILIWGIAQGMYVLVFLAIATYSCLAITHSLIVFVSDRSNAPISLFGFPIAVAVEMYTVTRSMIAYEFYSVIWKGRNICIPVMHSVSYRKNGMAAKSRPGRVMR